MLVPVRLFTSLMMSLMQVVGLELFRFTPQPTLMEEVSPRIVHVAMAPPIFTVPFAYKSFGHLIPSRISGWFPVRRFTAFTTATMIKCCTKPWLLPRLVIVEMCNCKEKRALPGGLNHLFFWRPEKIKQTFIPVHNILCVADVRIKVSVCLIFSINLTLSYWRSSNNLVLIFISIK